MQVLQVQLEVGTDPAEVGRARRWARARLAHSGIEADEPLAETLVLIVSELVTNAVVHTGCPAVLQLLLCGAEGGTDPAPSSPGQEGSGKVIPGPPLHPPAAAAPPKATAGTPLNGSADAPCAAARPPRAEIGTVRVEVADASGRPPCPREADRDETDGRGLALIGGLADRWGWEPEGSGKRVWCELDRGPRDFGAGAPGARSDHDAGDPHGSASTDRSAQGGSAEDAGAGSRAAKDRSAKDRTPAACLGSRSAHGTVTAYQTV